MRIRPLFFLIILIFHSFVAVKAEFIETVYGEIEITEPVLLDLIKSPVMQRLKKVHQYGIGHMVNDKEEYSRYDHSLGVFTLLRLKGLSIEEQMAGLLHDASHTTFSHFGDFLYGMITDKDSYQDSIHEQFLKKYGVEGILKKHNYSISQVLHKSAKFIALERDLPNLCADRIDYNLQGAYLRGSITEREMLAIVNDLQFDGENWTMSRIDLANKLSQFSMHMTLTCWSSAANYLSNMWLRDIVERAFSDHLLNREDIAFGTDKEVWSRLVSSPDPYIQRRVNMILNADKMFSYVEEDSPQHLAGTNVPIKFRGINPLIRTNDGLVSLTEVDKAFNNEYHRVKSRSTDGWSITFSPSKASAVAL
ncbi:Uncharacterized protein SCG7109_AZ_00080 [Chlamydiales bacterium SCGC AG-110-M15]|nr:Uncharacterized protein SCG7109_AZ_00080 [Chlamydiales bacterium SCGC AG-110-M15]